jgi:hypothetical protein
MQAMHPDISGGSDRLGQCGLPYLHRSAVLHRLYGSLSRPAILGSDACAPGETVTDDKTADKISGSPGPRSRIDCCMKLARVESREIQNRSPWVRSIISESVTIARMVVEASKAKL